MGHQFAVRVIVEEMRLKIDAVTSLALKKVRLQVAQLLTHQKSSL